MVIKINGKQFRKMIESSDKFLLLEMEKRGGVIISGDRAFSPHIWRLASITKWYWWPTKEWTYANYLDAKPMMCQFLIDLCLTVLHSKSKFRYLKVYFNLVHLAGLIRNLQALKIFAGSPLRYIDRCINIHIHFENLSQALSIAQN